MPLNEVRLSSGAIIRLQKMLAAEEVRGYVGCVQGVLTSTSLDQKLPQGPPTCDMTLENYKRRKRRRQRSCLGAKPRYSPTAFWRMQYAVNGL